MTVRGLILAILLALIIALFAFFGNFLFPVTINYVRSLGYEITSITNTMRGYSTPVNPFPAYQQEKSSI